MTTRGSNRAAAGTENAENASGSESSLSARAFTAAGESRESVQLPPEMFDGTVNMPVMHQAVKAYLANQRQGNASTKTRGFVVGGNRKPWRQKGTGRARQGSTRAPNWVGGGTVFGPSPRSYAESVPKKVKALARKSAFNARARENAVIVIDAFNFDAPKTAQMLSLLDSVGVADRKVLVLTDGVKSNVFLSARNLTRVHVMPFSDASTYHLLWSDVVVVEGSVFGGSRNEASDREEAPKSRRAKTGTRASTATRAKTSTAGKTATRRKAEK